VPKKLPTAIIRTAEEVDVSDFAFAERDEAVRRAPARAVDAVRESPHVGRGVGSGARLRATDVLRLQRAVGNASTASLLASHGDEKDESAQQGGNRSPVHDTIAGSGSPLEPATRADMEQRLGASFSSVRLHVDAKSAESVQAAAYTVGENIVVHPNHFRPGSPSAQRTLAHELTHVVQQRQGPVDGADAPGGIRVSDPGDRFEREAEQRANEVMDRPNASAPGRLGASASADAATVQTSTVQRQEEEEHDEHESDGG
jgi:hypothetical protein